MPRNWIIVGLILAILVALGHAWGIDTGLFLDDHSHYARLRTSDWSFGSAVEASRLGIVGDVLDVWDRHEVGLRFFRPIAFWTMKLEYTLAGWRPWVMHVLSLGWHWAASMLVAVLAWRCLGKVSWAGVAGGVFAVHPGQVACTYWVASQSELQVTVWLLLATLCYARYSAWPVPLFGLRTDWYPDRAELPQSRPSWLAWTCVCFALGLGCRENAVMFMPLIFLGDLLFRGMGRAEPRFAFRRMRWSAYGLFAVLFGAYMLLRWRMLDGFPLPGKPYLVTMNDPEFWPFIVNKFVLNILAIFAFVPVVPLSGLAFFQARAAEFYLPFAGIVVGWAALLWLLRRRPGLILAFGWLILMMLPLLPVFSSPHHLYLPSVGFAVILACALGMAGGCFLRHGEQLQFSRKTLTAVIVGLHAVGLTFGCWAMGWVYRASTGIEDLVLRDVRDVIARPIRDGDHLFFINIPMMAYYVVPALEQDTGLRDLKGHALTFSPNPLLMDQPCRVEALDEYTLRLSIEGDPFFGGMSGRVLLEGMGLDRMPAERETFDAGLYRVTIERADEAGIRELSFRFDKRLDTPEYHFFLTTRQRMAYPLVFGRAAPELRTARSDHSPI